MHNLFICLALNLGYQSSLQFHKQMEHLIIFLRAFIVFGYEKTKGAHPPESATTSIFIIFFFRWVSYLQSDCNVLEIFKASKLWTMVELKEGSPEVVDKLIDAWLITLSYELMGGEKEFHMNYHGTKDCYAGGVVRTLILLKEEKHQIAALEYPLYLKSRIPTGEPVQGIKSNTYLDRM
ncbi:hypothetical protein Tco_0972605 [Tanacetum coccineum]